MRNIMKKGIEKDILWLLEDVVNTFRSSVLVLDDRFRVILANDSYYRDFQTIPGQTKGRIVYRLGDGQWDIPQLHKLLASVLPKKKAFDDFEVERVFPKIGHKVMLLNARQLKIRIGRQPLILLVINDITQKKLLLAALIQTGKLSAIGQLSAGIVHGLSSPLTGVVNFIDVYMRQEREGSVKRKELQLVQEGCKYMIEIVRNLTDFASHKKDNFTALNLGVVVESVLLFTERQFLVNNIKIIKDFPDNIKHIQGNKNQLQHAILNIMVNALESMKNGGTLVFKIRNSADRKYVVLSIADTGTGIGKENLSKVFEPFFTTKEFKGGAGLGLSVVYGIMEHFKGKVSVNSKVGKGTEVVLSFPVIKGGGSCITI